MTDFHTHILPGIDDGSRDLAMTRGLLIAEREQGVERVIATPHFYAYKTPIESFLKRRNRSLETVLQRIEGAQLQMAQERPGPEGLPVIRVGAEVYFFPGMGKASKLPYLCINGTNVILIEMPFQQWKEEILTDLRDILQRQRLRIVLAHVERYLEFQKDRGVWEQVLALPVTIQLNAGSFLKGWSKRRFCIRTLQEYENVILGSDCHNLDTRVPNLAAARAVIERKCGAERLAQIDRTMGALI